MPGGYWSWGWDKPLTLSSDYFDAYVAFSPGSLT